MENFLCVQKLKSKKIPKIYNLQEPIITSCSLNNSSIFVISSQEIPNQNSLLKLLSNFNDWKLIVR